MIPLLFRGRKYPVEPRIQIVMAALAYFSVVFERLAAKSHHYLPSPRTNHNQITFVTQVQTIASAGTRKVPIRAES